MDIVTTNQSTYVTATGTTAVFPLGGILVRITLGSSLGTAIKVYDGNQVKHQLDSGIPADTYEYGISIGNGLNITTTGSQTALVVWRQF